MLDSKYFDEVRGDHDARKHEVISDFFNFRNVVKRIKLYRIQGGATIDGREKGKKNI